MVKIKIITIGNLKEKYLVDGCKEYLKRLSRYAKLDVIELSEEKISSNPSLSEIEQVKIKECERILKKITERDYVIVLDVNGKQFDSVEFAKYIDEVMISNSCLVFVILGSYGLADNLRKRANLLFSLSKATFTHQLTRLIVLEQIYRIFKILNNETYHKWFILIVIRGDLMNNPFERKLVLKGEKALEKFVCIYNGEPKVLDKNFKSQYIDKNSNHFLNVINALKPTKEM